MLEWLFILETEYAQGDPHWHTVTQIHSRDACVELITATLEDLKDSPCSYVNRGSGAPLKATGMCYPTGGQDIRYKIRDGSYSGPYWVAWAETDDLAVDHEINLSQLGRAQGRSETKAYILNGGIWEPIQ